MTLRLYFITETEKARLYARKPKEQAAPSDRVWIPKAQCLSTLRFPNGLHEIEVSDAFAEWKVL